MLNKPSPELQTAIYLGLVAREATAPSDLVNTFLHPLIDAIRATFASDALLDQTIIDDCVIDTLLNFPQRLEKYDPDRGSLWTYLYVDAKRDILNAIDKDVRRRRNEEQVLPHVAVLEQDRNVLQETEEFDAVNNRDGEELDLLPNRLTLDEVQKEVQSIISNPTDQAVVQLIIDGVRDTEAYSTALGILHLSLPEQRHQVKQAKDKLKKRLIRLGAKLT